jgi:hypothetical protein
MNFFQIREKMPILLKFFRPYKSIFKTFSNPVKRVLVDSLTENLPLSMAERISGVPHPTIVKARKDECHNQLDKLSVNVF